ncbi:MAG: asparagine synthetase B [Haloarculaceae archaeon]
MTRAASCSDPLPGLERSPRRGFAAALGGPEGPVLLRDVLGRYPLFAERDGSDWAFDRSALPDPVPVPAGHARGPVDGETAEELVWSLPERPPERDHERAVAAIGDAIEAALRTAVEETEADEAGGTAVAFSGGVDSALVAAGLGGPCYVAGFPDSHDLEVARAAADAMGLDLRVVELDHADVERAVPRVAGATGRTNAMDVSIALPLYLVAERAATDGFDRLAVGQGADELFGGYQKVANASEDRRVRADTVRGARRETVRSLPGQLERDVLALRAAGAEPVAPLLDDRVVAAALSLPGGLLVDGDERKVALRRVASAWVPDSVATRDKKAVQYGSLVSRELDRLARQAGFKRRMDRHVDRYVESLLRGGTRGRP